MARGSELQPESWGLVSLLYDVVVGTGAELAPGLNGTNASRPKNRHRRQNLIEEILADSLQ